MSAMSVSDDGQLHSEDQTSSYSEATELGLIVNATASRPANYYAAGHKCHDCGKHGRCWVVHPTSRDRACNQHCNNLGAACQGWRYGPWGARHVCCMCPHKGGHQSCTQKFPVKDCIDGTWGEWSKCSKTCNGGTIQRRKSEKQRATAHGRPCPQPRIQKNSCNEEPCPGYHLDGKEYRANECTCKHGDAAGGANCSSHEEEMCTNCSAGYHLSSNQTCDLNICRCEGGTGYNGTECEEQDSANCSACASGNDPSDDGTCPRNQSPRSAGTALGPALAALLGFLAA